MNGHVAALGAQASALSIARAQLALEHGPDIDLSAEEFALIVRDRASDPGGLTQEDVQHISRLAAGLDRAELADAVLDLSATGHLASWMDAVDRPYLFGNGGLDATARADLFRLFAAMRDTNALIAVHDALPTSEGLVRSILPLEYLEAFRPGVGDEAAKIALVEHVLSRAGGTSPEVDQSLGTLVGSIHTPPSLAWTVDVLDRDGILNGQELLVIDRVVRSYRGIDLTSQLAALDETAMARWLAWQSMVTLTPAGVRDNERLRQQTMALFGHIAHQADGGQLARIWNHVRGIEPVNDGFRAEVVEAFGRGLGDQSEEARLRSVEFVDALRILNSSGDRLGQFAAEMLRGGHADTLNAMLRALAHDIGSSDPDTATDAARLSGFLFGAIGRALRDVGPSLNPDQIASVGVSLINLAISVADRLPRGADWAVGEVLNLTAGQILDRVNRAIDEGVDRLIEEVAAIVRDQTGFDPLAPVGSSATDAHAALRDAFQAGVLQAGLVPRRDPVN